MEDINTVEVTKESFIWTYEGLHSVKTAVSHPVCIILSLEILLYFNSRTLCLMHIGRDWEFTSLCLLCYYLQSLLFPIKF